MNASPNEPTSHELLAKQVLESLSIPVSTFPEIAIVEDQRSNAAKCMVQLFCNRISAGSYLPEQIKIGAYKWRDGTLILRNSRVGEHHWSSLGTTVVETLHADARSQPLVYVLTHWDVEQGTLHVWAIPEPVAYTFLSELPTGQDGTRKTIKLFPSNHAVKDAPSSGDLSRYYLKLTLSLKERSKLSEAVKIDKTVKKINQDQDDEEDSGNAEPGDTELLFSEETVAYLEDLADHTEDSTWHEQQKDRYARVLRDPAKQFVDMLRTNYIERLSPEVAGGKGPLSRLKKNDFGKGGYHDHYWMAFYDPAAGSKTKSVQLYFRMLGKERLWRYGFAFGNYCEDYLKRLKKAILENRSLVIEFFQNSPDDTLIKLVTGEETLQWAADQFVNEVLSDDSVFQQWFGDESKIDDFNVIREFALAELPNHQETLVQEVGEFFTWAWPLFRASTSGDWSVTKAKATKMSPEDESEDDVDEFAPQSLSELGYFTSLSPEFLEEIEQSLLAKQQVVLVGPPGTSKTYIARQFARYFVRQKPGRPQGTHHVLYMHANWSYEDFFEGIKPTTSENGTLTFSLKQGFFLEWVEQLRDFDPKAQHVLVLDEINRCDTAAVLGELLQLLEYRGTTVRLLSGRRFVFPRNLFIIGTMNSADRSIGRLDLALRRRFLWLNLHPQMDTLQRWLDRLGNNPIGFKSSTLAECNALLHERGILPEQHIGHALFMTQKSDVDDETAAPDDIPLSEKHLRRIVQFSVMPYVRELLTAQFGQHDDNLESMIEAKLLSCLEKADSSTPAAVPHD
ncbi:hypothetical protein DTL21_07805 [Bremerella cremea]|uniref:AAA+ ATPase domain-containing protein n=1 Tax=Blastopirellula marina TaxID=124 RepID=A0A2S8G078_9BACT|nr:MULTISPECIES: AAA family ATPase [Pirellulaceae]PQO37836.1 hypothetical protein C5Y83_07800 [Blastopirellula marina]RCS50224.1 hypothetical protein DTL21_07805 [Bremerella cremea]